jgi:hypothetical protein
MHNHHTGSTFLHEYATVDVARSLPLLGFVLIPPVGTFPSPQSLSGHAVLEQGVISPLVDLGGRAGVALPGLPGLKRKIPPESFRTTGSMYAGPLLGMSPILQIALRPTCTSWNDLRNDILLPAYAYTVGQPPQERTGQIGQNMSARLTAAL